MIEQIISLAGAGMILLAYAALQWKWIAPNHLSYILLNLIGSVILAVIAFRIRQVGLTALEGVWAIISLVALFRYFRTVGTG